MSSTLQIIDTCSELMIICMICWETSLWTQHMTTNNSHIELQIYSSWEYLMTHSSPYKSCPYFPHSGPVGCLPAPNIFHLANEFAKGKMFWNIFVLIHKIIPRIHSSTYKTQHSPIDGKTKKVISLTENGTSQKLDIRQRGGGGDSRLRIITKFHLLQYVKYIQS